MASSTQIRLPGFGLPVSFLPDEEDRFPVLVGNSDIDFKAKTLTIRELCMLRFIEEITNKPDWWTKVHDEEIAARWKAEALEMNWAAYLKHGDFSPKMADACIEELKIKADLFEKTNLIPVFDYTAAVVKSDRLISEELWRELKEGVKVLEDVPDEEKDWHPGSDGKVLDLVHPSLFPLVYGTSRIVANSRIGLADALESCGTGDVIPTPETLKGNNFYSTSTKFQWLPCDVSVKDGRATIESYINNLHPINHAPLYAIIERFIEKALPAWDVVYRWHREFDMQRLTTEDASTRCRSRRTCAKSDHTCSPKARPTREDEPRRDRHEDQYSDDEVSESEREMDSEEDEDDNENSDDDEHVHYQGRNEADKDDGIPMVLPIRAKNKDDAESEYESENYDSDKGQDDGGDEQEDSEEEEEEEDEDDERNPNHVSEKEVKRRDWRWYYKTHPVDAPEPIGEPQVKIRPKDIKSTDFFSSAKPDAEQTTNNSQLQVIVKLANIHLTPDEPSYAGGSWHVEGQINEHICATALFYYDCDNITDSHLDFRTQSNGEELDDDNLSYEQYDWRTIQRIFAINWPGGGSTIQNIGSVLTKQGRALFFPNVYQHHVNSFKLADPTRPGHRKILALFLVDPAIPVISTANVPPQQKSWWVDQVAFSKGRLPPELTEMMLGNVEFPMNEEQAKELREELMKERSMHAWRVADKMKRVEWNFCEH